MAVIIEKLSASESFSDFLSAKLLSARFALTMSKDILLSSSAAEKYMDSIRYQQPPYEPGYSGFDNVFSTRRLGSGTVCTFTPRWISCSKRILYFYGGGFIFEPMSEHFRFLDQLAAELRCEITVFCYPLTPTYTYADTYAPAAGLYRSMAEKYGADNIVLMGDSAGGTIAMTLCGFLRSVGLPAPGGLVCFSPCCDLRLDNPDIPAYEKDDPVLGAAGQRRICKSWCGARNMDDPLLNPMCMDVSALPETLILCGTNELLYPDIRLFVSRAFGKGKLLEVHVYEGMFHAFQLFSLNAAEHAKKITASWIEALA